MAATAPIKELGYANESYNWWLYDGETTPELIWPQSVFVYDQMRRSDSQVRSVLQATTLPVRRTPWRLDPAGARDEVVELIADDLGLPIVGQQPKPQPRTKDRFSWADHLRQALLMLPFGFMFFEQVYRIDPDGSRAHLRKLAPRMPRTIQRIDVAPDGGLIQISQYSSIAQTYPGQTQRSLIQEPIPVDRLVGYVYELEGGNWIGHSVLRSCYKNWLIKDRLLRVQAQTIERNGMGVPLYKAQDGASETDMIAGKAMAMAWRAGEAAGSAVPFGADVVLRGVEGTLPDADPAIRYHDEQIARGVLAHFLNLGTQTGSWALGSTFADFFTMSLQTLAQQIADTFTQHVIEDLVDLNFGESEPAPKLVFDEIGSRQSATAEALKALIDAGAVIPDRNTEENLRQMYGLPPKEEGAPSPPGPTTPGAGGPPVTPEPAPGPSPEPPTTAPEYAIPAPGLQAGAGHPKGEAAGAVAARFNPDELRGPDGKWAGGGSVVEKLAHALTGQKALGAAPAKLKRAPGGHHGDYAGEALDAPRGHGSVRALSEYEGVEYVDTNNYLRHGPQTPREEDLNPSSAFHGLAEQSNRSNAHRVAEIDKTMNVSPLASNVELHRVVKDGSATFGRDAYYGHLNVYNTEDFDEQDRMFERWEAGERPDLTGMKWTDAGYSSTSADPSVVQDFGKRFLSSHSAYEGEPIIMHLQVPEGTGGVQLAEWGHAAEILLERGLKFEVVADHGVGDDGFRHLDVVVSRG